ncbi:MAG: 5-deoxy-glucuronate isomerase [Bacteroidota bacterium]
MSSKAKSAEFIRSTDVQFEYQVKSTPVTSNLDLITYGKYILHPSYASDELFHTSEEALLFCMNGPVELQINEIVYELNHYDVLYVPLQTVYRIINPGYEKAEVIICKAPALNKHEVYYSKWEELKNDESRIRHLDGKDVFLAFDVSEKADKLMAGYTIYDPNTRAWPPHNHTDQEEIYIFTKGKGAMEVYPDEKSKTFVQGVNEMDAVTIPILNYHPVFSQEEDLDFIWCIAGERYWVGDKDKTFLDGDTDSLTT